jgi:hypothetical protein
MEHNTQGFRPQTQTDLRNTTVTTFIRPDNKVAILVETSVGEHLLIHPDGFTELVFEGQPGSDLSYEIVELVNSIS